MPAKPPEVHGPEPRSPDALPALPPPYRHYRLQDEVLRPLLRLQGWPHRPRWPSPPRLAAIRMAPAGHPLGRLPHRTHDLPIPPEEPGACEKGALRKGKNDPTRRQLA